LTDFGSLLTFLAALFAFLQSRTAKQQSRANGDQIEDVHKLVNSQHTETLDRVDQLKETLNAAGVDIPPSPPGTQDAARGEEG